MTERVRTLVLAGALAVCLIAGSPPRIVGDGGEYLAQAMNFAAFNGPPLGRRAIADIERRINDLEPVLAEWRIEQATVPSSDRRRDFLHFWFYALLATPALWVTDAVGAPPTYAFALTNLLLLGWALVVVTPRIGPWATLLIFAGPLVWWIDKPHTEVFTVALLAIALALARERPGAALIAAGMAATQNLPVIALFGLLVLSAIATRRRALVLDRAWITGLAVGGALALLHPVYTYLRHGTPSLLLYATRPGVPTVAELSAVVTDPSMGLIGNAPVALLVVLIGGFVLLRRRAAALVGADMIVAGLSAMVFLYAFAQTSNSHHGATPSLSRYALWLFPLTIPLFSALASHGGRVWRSTLASGAVMSSLISVFAFHPGVQQNTREPTWLATWLWTTHPGWNNPLPEVFSETQLHVEGTTVPVATDQCEKVLLASGAPDGAVWPVPCYPAPIPALCRGPEAVCYANRLGNEYAFVRAPGREDPPLHAPDAAWPTDAEPHVRALFDAWEWWDLTTRPASVVTVRSVQNVRAATFGTDERFLVVLRPGGAGASLMLRPQYEQMSGRLVDAQTGASVRDLAFAGPAGEAWTIDLPADHAFLILALTRGASAP